MDAATATPVAIAIVVGLLCSLTLSEEGWLLSALLLWTDDDGMGAQSFRSSAGTIIRGGLFGWYPKYGWIKWMKVLRTDEGSLVDHCILFVLFRLGIIEM